jgi:glycosyltransferase involved in cell wall biosynthesis
LNQKVTIITPVYNASRFIASCAKSLFEQSFDSIEYIFIDDASTDNSIEILRQIIDLYPEKKEFCKIVTQPENKGPGAAKQLGIDISTGDYLIFIDADDYIDDVTIESLYTLVEAENAAIAVCDLWLEFGTNRKYVEDFVSRDFTERMKSMVNNKRTNGFLCNKLIKRELFDTINTRIPDDLRYLEDLFITTRLYFYAQKIVKINQPFYHYVKYNPGSVTARKQNYHFQSLELYWQLQDVFFKENDLYDQFRDDIEELKVETKLILMFDCFSYQSRKKYGALFSNEQQNQYQKLKFGEKLMVNALKHKLYLISVIIPILVSAKAFIMNKLSIKKS